MLDALIDGFKNDKISASDRVLFHTADGATYLAISKYLTQTPAKDCPVFHVCTPYDPVGVMPNRDTPEEVHQAITQLKTKKLIEKKYSFMAKTHFLQNI